jgi:hypothetical protein
MKILGFDYRWAVMQTPNSPQRPRLTLFETKREAIDAANMNLLTYNNTEVFERGLEGWVRRYYSSRTVTLREDRQDSPAYL